MSTTTLVATQSRHMNGLSFGKQRTAALTHKSQKAAEANDPIGNVKGLYAPAARAFVRKDFALTHTLMEAALVILLQHPPVVSIGMNTSGHDSLSTLRRKWDLLRITLETTAYTSLSPQSSSLSKAVESSHSSSVANSLQPILSLEPNALVQSLHSRSEQLHSPKGYRPSPLYIPASILSALVFAALKLDCAGSARNLVEAWLAFRRDAMDAKELGSAPVNVGPQGPSSLDVFELVDLSSEGYEKVLDVYCLQVLPRLGEWDYAMEFLKYEPELSLEKRKHIYTSLKTLHTQVMNPVAPALRASRSSSSSSLPIKSPASTSDDSASSAATPRPGVQIISSGEEHPIRLSSAFSSTSASSSTTDLSSASSQQTVRASQYPHPGTGAAGARASRSTSHSLASLSPLSNGSTQPKSRSSSGSPDARGRGNDKGKGKAVNADGPLVGSGSGRGSAHGPQRTSFPRPPRAPPLDDPLLVPANGTTAISTIAGSPLTSKDPSRRRLPRPSVMEALKLWVCQTLHLDSAEVSDRRVITSVLFVFAVVVPLLAYVARLRGWKLGRKGRGLGLSGASLEGSGSHIGLGGPLGASARQASLAARQQARLGTASTVGVVLWLYESVKDSVIMAGKGLV